MVFLGLSRALGQSSSVSRALESAGHSADFSLAPGLNAPLLAALLERRASAGASPAVLAITPTSRESDALRNALGALVPTAQIVTFPAWETLPHERLSPSAEIVGARFDALRTISGWNGETPLVVLASVRAALQPLASNLRFGDGSRQSAGIVIGSSPGSRLLAGSSTGLLKDPVGSASKPLIRPSEPNSIPVRSFQVRSGDPVRRTPVRLVWSTAVLSQVLL